jgi:hypothetical protein
MVISEELRLPRRPGTVLMLLDEFEKIHTGDGEGAITGSHTGCAAQQSQETVSESAHVRAKQNRRRTVHRQAASPTDIGPLEYQ